MIQTRLGRLMDYFRGTKPTAILAKERLQIIVSHERAHRTGPDFLPALQKELLDVISKYVSIDRNQVRIDLARDGDCSILELNIALPNK